MARPTWLFVLVAVPVARAAAPSAADDSSSAVWAMTREAAARALLSVAPRTVFHDSARTRHWSETDAAALPAALRDSLVSRTLDDHFYYYTRYGTPLACVRPLELLARNGLAGVRGKRIVDFGYGTIGHLRMLASLGADVTGIEVDPLLPVLYGAPGDQDAIAGAGGAPAGHLRLLDGRFPAEPGIVGAAGEGYDVFLSKNTLKRGHIHPAEPVAPRRLVHLGVDDSTFLAALHRVLKPGGLAMIYNLAPAPAPPGKPYIPWADGRSPFTRAQWAAAGDRPAARPPTG